MKQVGMTREEKRKERIRMIAAIIAVLAVMTAAMTIVVRMEGIVREERVWAQELNEESVQKVRSRVRSLVAMRVNHAIGKEAAAAILQAKEGTPGEMVRAIGKSYLHIVGKENPVVGTTITMIESFVHL